MIVYALRGFIHSFASSLVQRIIGSYTRAVLYHRMMRLSS